MRSGAGFALIDVLLAQHIALPGAYLIPGAGLVDQSNDTKKQIWIVDQVLSITKGNRDFPIVFYCEGVRCWESYNAAVRAITAGFTNVYWYRGGITAWYNTEHPTQRPATPPIRQASAVPPLQQLAHAALNEYYRRHGSDSRTPPSGIADLYAPQVTWYRGAQLSPNEILTKKINEVFKKWPTRHFRVRESSYDCNLHADSCRVTGAVEFSFVNADGKALDSNAMFELEFADMTGKPKVISEWSHRDTVK
jgi:rhodanese-related sulfurtransferase